MRTTIPLLGLTAALLVTLPPSVATGQTIRGEVTELETGEPVAGADVALLYGSGRRAARTRTDDGGQFVIGAPRAGQFLVEVSASGFAESTPVEVQVDAQEAVLVTVVLSRQVVALEPLIVTGRRYDPRHDATWRGALARREIHGRYGSQRVFMHGDIEMRNSMSVVEVARGVQAPMRGTMRTLSDPTVDGPRRTRAGCSIVFWDGNLALSAHDAMWALDTPPSLLEAVEVYRTWHDAPQGLRAVPMYAQTSPGNCSVIALWSRTGTHPDDPARQGHAARRSLIAATVVLLMLLAVPAL